MSIDVKNLTTTFIKSTLMSLEGMNKVKPQRKVTRRIVALKKELRRRGVAV